MRKVLENLSIKILTQTRIGRRITHNLRTKYPQIWRALKNFRQKNTLSGIITQVPNPVVDVPAQFYEKLTTNDISTDSYILNYSTPTAFRQHDIHNFALDLSYELEKFNLKIFNISKPNSEPWPYSGDLWIGESSFVIQEPHISIYHLGNNPDSEWILNSLTFSTCSFNIVILHDIWLKDLCLFHGRILGNQNLVEKIVFDDLGLRGLALLSNLENNVSKSTKLEISKPILKYVLGKANLVITHTASKDWTHIVESLNSDINLPLSLPLNYIGKSEYSETNRNIEVIISGQDSPFKDLKKSVKIMQEILHSNPQFTGLIAGGIANTAEKFVNSNHFPEYSRNRIQFRDGQLSGELWDDIHTHSKVGIRLGVGNSGESSGSIRDYLSYGLFVITDDEEFESQNHDKIYFLSRDQDFNVSDFEQWLNAATQKNEKYEGYRTESYARALIDKIFI
ncbi:MAG: hypothetical protein RL129_104 [Actinomycetota bacterium]